MQALGTVRLPYDSADPWPRHRARAARRRAAHPRRAVDLLAASGRAARAGRTPLEVPERGYPFVALAVMIVVVASPIVSIGGARPGAARADDRGAGGAASCGSNGCRCGPGSAWPGWSGWRSWARCRSRRRPIAASRGSTIARSPRASGPTTRCASRGRRATGRSRGRATATRCCASCPASRCTGRRATWTRSTAIAWQVREEPQDTRFVDEPFEADVPEDYEERARVDERDRGLDQARPDDRRDRRGHDHRRSATTRASSSPASRPARGTRPRGLRRNDSYRARVHFPKPQGAALEEATVGELERQDGQRTLTVPFQPGAGPDAPARRVRRVRGR